MAGCREAVAHFLAKGASNTAGAEAKEAILDFFGVSAKAEELPVHVERMDLLAKKVSSIYNKM